jgi:hypothetical protein
MSATKIFLVYAPYYTDADILARRNVARAGHLEHMGSLIKDGIVRVGGVLMEAEPVDEKSPNPVGSSIIVKMGSVKEVREMLEEDIYYTGNVWDKEKLVVLPYVLATAEP